jgi:hypothetical protein
MEPEKKFKNLSLQYRNYLDEVNKILISYNPKIKYSFIDINKYYNMVNDINNRLLILENDIYHLFMNYEKTNETIFKLKNLLKQRNKIIIRNLLTSKKYKDYVNKLSQDNKRSIKKYADAIPQVRAATTPAEITQILRSNSINYKNGNMMGGKRTKKLRKQKGGFVYRANTKRRSLSSTSRRRSRSSSRKSNKSSF